MWSFPCEAYSRRVSDLVVAHSSSQTWHLRAYDIQRARQCAQYGPLIDGAKVPLRHEDLQATTKCRLARRGQQRGIYRGDGLKWLTFLLSLCILSSMALMEAMVSSGEAVPSWALCVASLMVAVMAFVSLSMVRWAVLKLRRMSSRGTLRSGASRMIWLSGTSFVGLPILWFHTDAPLSDPAVSALWSVTEPACVSLRVT